MRKKTFRDELLKRVRHLEFEADEIRQFVYHMDRKKYDWNNIDPEQIEAVENMLKNSIQYKLDEQEEYENSFKSSRT